MKKIKQNGPLLIFLSSIMLGLMGFLVKLTFNSIPAGEIIFFRFLGGYAFALVLRRAGFFDINTKKLKFLIVNAMLIGCAALLYFLSIGLTTLSKAAMLSYTAPIFSAIFGLRFYKEKNKTSAIVVMILCLIGTYLILTPSFDNFQVGDFLGLLSGIIMGFAALTLRELRKTESAWAIFYYFNLVGFLFSFPLLTKGFLVPSPVEGLLIAGVIISAITSHLLLTYAYRYCSAVEAGTISLFAPVAASMLGIIVLKEVWSITFLAGSMITLTGSAYLVSCNFFKK